MTTADELVNRYILEIYRDGGDNDHLRGCAEASIEESEAYDSCYGCTTGCEYARLEATIACPHGERDDDFTYGEFGRISDIIKWLETEEKRCQSSPST